MVSVFTVPAHVPFLDAVAAELLRRPGEDLADTLVLLPSRRACLALREAMLRRAGGQAMLLPRLQPVGEIETDELMLDPAAELELLPALPPLRRHLLLTRLVLARDGSMAHEQAIRLAAELMRFLDEVATESVALAGLDSLVTGELAEHWQQTLNFLKILTQVWPEVVHEQGKLDPVERRNRLLAAWAERWQADPPLHPVLAAGITGSIPKVAALLGVVARLPQGAVLLPGFDQDIDDGDWAEIGPNHPQHCLKQLIEGIGVKRDEVRPWPVHGVPGGAPERARFLAEVMRPAATSDGWQRRTTAPAGAVTGIEIVTAPDLASEAVQLALRIRGALEEPGRRVALVTSDRNLARRVAIELGRWDVRADDSAGIPLDQSPPGSFLLLAAHCVVGDGKPLALLALLKHPLASGGMAQGEFRRRVRALERVLLRGPRRAGGIEGLLAELKDWPAQRAWMAPVPRVELAAWVEWLLEAARPFRSLLAHGSVPLADLLQEHLAFASLLAADEAGNPKELWAREAGVAAQRFVVALREAAGALGDTPASAYPALLAVLMARETVRPRAPAHPRVSILGQLESRLQQADLVLIGGLNEGVWPRYAESGPWLSRSMRAEFGLPPAELQVGIAAHDLFMAASAPEVVFSRARKDEAGAPTIPSRWLARLEAVLEVAQQRRQVDPKSPWQHWAHRLDAPKGPVRPCAPPTPRPPLAARPRGLAVTEMEMLVRDPYSVYARHVLGLRPLDPLDADPGNPERGQVIHEVLEQFVEREIGDSDPLAVLLELGRRHFGRFAQAPEVRALWWPRFVEVAAWFCEHHRLRQQETRQLATEVRGSLIVDSANGPFRIRARADRVELRHDGGLAILDYKTGTLPDAKQVRAGLRPQLVLEALIAADGGFDGLPATEPTELLYWGLRGSEEEPGKELNPLAKVPLKEVLAEARVWLQGLLDHYADPASAYLPVPRPDIAPARGDYEHLARIGEWRDAETGE